MPVKNLDDRGVERVLLTMFAAQLDQVSLQISEERNVAWDDRVHRVRSGLKTARSLLRLLRYGLGENAWRSANLALRDAGRAFSEARDCDVLVSLCRELSTRRRLAATLSRFEPTLLERQRRSLDDFRNSHAAERALLLIDTARSYAHRADAREGWDGAWWGVGRVYKLARRASKDGDAADLDRRHELRKRSKDLRAHFQFLRSRVPCWRPRAEPQLEQLTDRLGEDRDLRMFGMALRTAADMERLDAESVFSHIDQRCRRALANVQLVVKKLYGEEPRQFVDRARSDFERALDGGRTLRHVAFAVVGAASALTASAVLWPGGRRPSYFRSRGRAV
jgi:CHAD domain-containing protein